MRYEDEVKGKGKQVVGKAKEHLGKLAGDRDLEDRGKQERFEGSVQSKVGKVRGKSARLLRISAIESPANGDAGDSSSPFSGRREAKDENEAIVANGDHGVGIGSNGL